MSAIIQFLATLFFVSLVSSVSGCSTTGASNDGQIMPEKISLTSKDNGELVREFTDPNQIGNLLTALDNREQRYEKLLPLFDYRLDITKDGEPQTWLVNKAGYVRKSDSPELFKMDVSALFQ